MNYLFIITNFLFIFSMNAQFNFEHSNTISVLKGVDTLNLAFSGGLSYPQFSDIDFDFDGDMDLFVFDRSSSNIRMFIHEVDNGKHYYRSEFNARTHLPKDLRYRATMVDYNGDGKKDLFTYGIGGIKVYKNVGDAVNGLQWSVASNLLYSDNWGTSLNLYVSSADIPAFTDVEGDGDIDVLTFHISGQHVQYHQNQSIELYGVPDSLIFVLQNECWGGFREDINSSALFLNDNSLECSTGNIPGAKKAEIDSLEKKGGEGLPKHSGSSLLALDYDHSGVLDLVLGDVAFPNLTLLLNGGKAPNTNSLMVSQDNNFPGNSLPVNLQIFPAAFWVDVDFDLLKDLIVCPNARNTPENEKSILFYKNVGTNQLPSFVYRTNEFLQNEMIEHGTGSQPTLVDIDNDGLKDLMVSNFYRYIPTLNKESSIAYYKNTGTSSTPKFNFIDFNFLDLNTSGLGLKMAPAFGDIDNDGDQDLYIGRENGTLTFLKNTSTTSTISFATPINNVTDKDGKIIGLGQYAYPQLFDLNKDGLLDLIIGRKTGELTYYRNVGSASSPSFLLENDTLGKIDVSTNSGDGYATPHFFRIKDTTILFLGAADGRLRYYKEIDGNLASSDSFQLVSDNYLNIDAGAYSSFWIDDIDNDGYLNMFVGQDLGGLYHFEANPFSSASLSEINASPSWFIYPNPANEELTIMWDSNDIIERILLLNATGQVIECKTAINSHTDKFVVRDLSKGVYFIQVESEKNISTKKIIKL